MERRPRKTAARIWRKEASETGFGLFGENVSDTVQISDNYDKEKPASYYVNTLIEQYSKQEDSDIKLWQCQVGGINCKTKPNLLKHSKIHFGELKQMSSV